MMCPFLLIFAAMSNRIKDQKSILEKLKIEKLNPMQEEAHLAIQASSEVVLLSPTGTGKTLAFLLPLIAELNPKIAEIQVLIIVPSRELAIQIEQVARDMGAGLKINSVYGGQYFSKDKMRLEHPPAILIGTPGRVADHLRRGTFNGDRVDTLVLDEFDKSLEIGFEEDMQDIINALPNVQKKILTSATEEIAIPHFVGLIHPIEINYLEEGVTQLKIKRIVSPEKDKLGTLLKVLCHLGNQPGIIFCNFKDSIRRVSDFLTENKISHGCFYGGMEQNDRERALLKFRNGTHQIIIATDLAARGIDVPEIKFIIHYHLPFRSQEFTHRNGRTARMNNDGTAFVLHWVEDELPEFIDAPEVEEILPADIPNPSDWKTIFISGGRKDKISKGDVAGFFIKKGEVEKDQLGIIELKEDCAFVAVKASEVESAVLKLDNMRLKKRKVRVRVI